VGILPANTQLTIYVYADDDEFDYPPY
jgi:hypothetical protein